MTNWMPNPANLTRPAYLSLAEQFARAIESGELPIGTRLMPHRKLADLLGLSVQTVSRAYDELIRRGLIAGEVGRGSFVLGPGAEARQPYLPERPGKIVDLSILKPVVEAVHLDRMREGFAWLASGGVLYTIGIIFFAYDSRFRHWHGIWHLFVMAGSLLHFVAIWRYVL